MTIIKKQQDKRNVTQLSWWQGEVRIQFSEIQSLHNYPPVYTYKKKTTATTTNNPYQD